MSEINISNPILIYGEKGLSITNIYRVADDLYIELSDGSELSVSGVKGAKGDTGVGIQSAALNQDGFLEITLTDSSVITSSEQVRGPKGDTGTAGADVNGGSVTNNQITLTKSDGSTVQVSGQIETATESPGDGKLTARNDYLNTAYLDVPELQAQVYDKNLDNNLNLWNELKIYNDQDRFDFTGVSDGDYFNESLLFYNKTLNGQSFNVFNWKGKWIRTIYTSFQHNSVDAFCIQVSDTVDFSTYREYILTEDANGFENVTSTKLALNCLFIPEQNKIITYVDNYMYIFNIDDADDFNNYSHADFGGLQQLPTEIKWDNYLVANSFIQIISLDRDPSDLNCKVLIHTSPSGTSSPSTSSFIIVDLLSNIETIYNSQYIYDFEYIDQNTFPAESYGMNGYHVYYDQNDALPVIANNRVYMFQVSQDILYSAPYDDITNLTVEIDNSAYNASLTDIGKMRVSTCKGSVFVAYHNNTEGNIYIKIDGETTFSQRQINTTVTYEDCYFYHYIKSKNFILARLVTRNNMSPSHHFYCSFDNGVTWREFFNQGTKLNDFPNFRFNNMNLMSQILPNDDNNLKLTPVENIYTESQFDHIVNKLCVMKHIETGYSDLFTVNPYFANSQIKLKLKK